MATCPFGKLPPRNFRDLLADPLPPPNWLRGFWMDPNRESMRNFLQVPICVKACTYPGTVIGGVMVSDVKFYYPVGSQVQYECSPGLTLNGAPMLECLENGIWSAAVPLCESPNNQ